MGMAHTVACLYRLTTQRTLVVLTDSWECPIVGAAARARRPNKALFAMEVLAAGSSPATTRHIALGCISEAGPCWTPCRTYLRPAPALPPTAPQLQCTAAALRPAPSTATALLLQLLASCSSWCLWPSRCSGGYAAPAAACPETPLQQSAGPCWRAPHSSTA